ncbi:Hypothetical protein CINCED_3A025836 [Cinara cedri]|uniref:Uncharacterized protein n=1 Tax=Cinara cedri TaxID=506608 RepID=A0A5E4N3S1_9HEMI|nr:Hypothetical protein CINCED_3A025836 [Cinara cedri]
MPVLNVMLAFSAILWPVTSGGLIMYDTKSFLFEVMENDAIWAEILNVEINIETSILSIAARSVLREMGITTPDNHEQVSQPEMNSNEVVNVQSMMISKGANVEADYTKPKTKKIVTANALHVLVHIVAMHYQESNALEFGLSVIVSAIKCQFLQIISIMLRVINETQIKEYNVPDYLVVWNNLELYLDKIARLKDSMAFEGAMYQEWQTVVANTDFIGIESQPILGDVKPIMNLVEQSLLSSCESKSLTNQRLEHVNINPETDSWRNVKGLHSIFENADNALEKLSRRIPVSTMEKNLWDLYVNIVKIVKYRVPRTFARVSD